MSTTRMRTSRTDACLVPSHPSSGERARVRGRIAGQLPHLNQHRSTTNAPLNSVPSRIPPHPNPLPPQTGGRGDKTRIDLRPIFGYLRSIFGGDE